MRALVVLVEVNAAVGQPRSVPRQRLAFAMREASSAVLVFLAVPDVAAELERPATDHGGEGCEGEDGLDVHATVVSGIFRW